MDSFTVGILALGVTIVVLFFAVKLYDRLRDGKSRPSQQELFVGKGH